MRPQDGKKNTVFSVWLQDWITADEANADSIPADKPGRRVMPEMAGGGPSQFRGGTPLLGFRAKYNPAGESVCTAANSPAVH